MFLLHLLHVIVHVHLVALETLIEWLVPPPNDKSKHDAIVLAPDIAAIAEASGYIVRDHVITTTDGYVLVLHKLESPLRKSDPSKVVYFHHGLLTNSELFVLGQTKKESLPYLLADLGYEVWLGNNRGNKYSRKHLKYSIADWRFWDFSLDEYALYDIPDTLEYIAGRYTNTKITFIGFSQGCSQLFASLSIKPALNDRLNLFVALSPAIVPRQLKHPLFRFIVEHTAKNPNFPFLLFGNRALMPSVVFWSHAMGSALYERVVDISLRHLFGWSCSNIPKTQKKIGYPRMFSNSSVKSLTHWFQIISAKRFQMYDETCKYGRTPLTLISKIKGHRVAPFPVEHHVNVPILLVYGDADLLVDIDKTMQLIMGKQRVYQHELEVLHCQSYEHMDTLWAADVYTRVFTPVITAIDSLHRNVISTSSLTTQVNEKITATLDSLESVS